MVTEFERRYTVNGHPGAVRLLAYLNSAHMGSYQDAVDSPIPPPTSKRRGPIATSMGLG
jgi:hypothetical protein